MKDANYWKEYRLKNRDRLKAYEKSRNAKRKALKECLVEPIEKPDIQIPIPKPHRCQTSYCPSLETDQFVVQDCIVWLCKAHRPA